MKICPNKNDVMYGLMEQALGKGLAHLVISRNGGNTIEFTPSGEKSNLFDDLLNKYHGDINKAIQAKAIYYGGVYLDKHNWLKGESVNEQGEPLNIIDERSESDIDYSPNPTVNKKITKIEVGEFRNRINGLFNIIAQERDSPVHYRAKRARLDNIRENTELLKSTQNNLDRVIQIGEQHLEYLNNLLKNKDARTDEVYSAVQMLDVWLDIKKLIPVKKSYKDELEKIHGKFDSISLKFDDLLKKTFIKEVKEESDIDLKNTDLTTNLQDRNFASGYTLASSRSGNIAVQAVNSFLDTARVQTKQAQNNLKEELKELSDFIKKNNIDISTFTEKVDNTSDDTDNNEKKEKDLSRLVLKTRINKDWFDSIANIRKSKSRAIRTKSRQEMQSWLNSFRKFITNNAYVINIDDFFDFDEESGFTRKENKDKILEISNIVDFKNKKTVEKVIEEKLNEQEKQLSNFFLMYKNKQDELKDGAITQEEYDRFLNNDHPKTFLDNLSVKIKDVNPYSDGKYNVLIPIKNDYWNDSFDKIDSDEKLSFVHNKVESIMNDLKSKLPFMMSNQLDPSFLPLVNKSLIKEGFNFIESVKDAFVPNWTFSDIIKDSKDIPIKFTGLTEEESNYIDKIETSDNLIAILSLFGESANHFYYFNNIKSSVLLGQEILKKATPMKVDYMGRPIGRKGREEYFEQGEGLDNEMELLKETINNMMFLHKTKPEFAIGSTFGTDSVEDLIKIVDGELDNIKNNISSLFSPSELQEERELLEKVEEHLKKNTIQQLKDKIASSKKGTEYNDLKALYTFYLDRLDTVKKEYKNKEIKEKDYVNKIKAIGYKMSLLQRKTIYGSKIIDSMISQRRVLSLMLNPMSAFRNYVGGFLNGLIYSGDGTDYSSKDLSKNLVKVTKLMINRKSDDSYKLYKIARNLLVLESPVDLQGLDEKSWFTEYGFSLMTASEISVRMAIMKSILDKEGMYDMFDKEGNLTSDSLTNEELSTRLKNITLKIERINTGIMGDTINYKRINNNVVGRAIGQFKSSWMPEAFASRLEDEKFDYKLNRTIKGRYNTYIDLGIVGSLVGVLEVYQTWLFGRNDNSFSNLRTRNGQPISQADILNLYRNTIEASFVLSLITLGYVLSYLKDDDDERKEFYMFMINQMLLIERDLTTVSPNTIQELVGGNLIPAWSVASNLAKAIDATGRFIIDDEYELNEWFYKVSKVVPILNVFSQFTYQTKHNLEQLN